VAEPRRLKLVSCYRGRVLCLKVPSDPGWATEALRDLDAVLVDHAHCEMKAASNALSLAARHPLNLSLVRALTDLAKEEIEHFQRVLTFLEARGLPLGSPMVDTYAADLRKAAGALPRRDAPPPLVDRLLVSALIEARSCERFKLLMGALSPARDPELHAFYTELFAAEARHYQVLIDLAIGAADGDGPRVLARLALLCDREGEIVRALAVAKSHARAAIHG
jgi:tRNA-(ms[2]io[6]A)-hydroxylase